LTSTLRWPVLLKTKNIFSLLKAADLNQLVQGGQPHSSFPLNNNSLIKLAKNSFKGSQSYSIKDFKPIKIKYRQKG